MTISGATETSYEYLYQYFQPSQDIHISHLPQELKTSNKPIKILWAEGQTEKNDVCAIYLFWNFD